MKNKTLRVGVDILMFVLMCFLAGTGLLIHYRLVPGYLGGHGLTLLGLTRHEWGTYHLWSAYLLLFLVIVHIVLNFAFVKNVIASKKPWIMILLGLVGLSVALFFLLMPIEKKVGGGKQHGRHSLKTESSKKEMLDMVRDCEHLQGWQSGKNRSVDIVAMLPFRQS